jgi:hypothetical protein
MLKKITYRVHFSLACLDVIGNWNSVYSIPMLRYNAPWSFTKLSINVKYMVADLCQLQFVVFSFCRGEKTTNDKTIIIVFSPRKDDKTTILGRKDDKHNPLINDLICRLFALILSSFRPEKTTKQKVDNTTKRQATNITH